MGGGGGSIKVKCMDLGNRKNGCPIPEKWNCKEKNHFQREDSTETWLTCSKQGRQPLAEGAEIELTVMANVHNV